jgi:hypothetical protein
LRIATIVAMLLSFSLASAAQTRTLLKATPLSVCEILDHSKDWDNNVVLIKAHYGSGMEDSFLWDEGCQGREIDLEFPNGADRGDKDLRDLASSHRIRVELNEDKNFEKFEKLVSVRNEKNVMCQKQEIILEAVGRVDTKRQFEEKNPNCRLDFGMCNYSARFVLESVKEVSATNTKPKCK